MFYQCEVCGAMCSTAPALGSHKRKHREKKNEMGELVEKLVDKLAGYRCPDCGNELVLMVDSIGIYKLKCQRCYEQGGEL